MSGTSSELAGARVLLTGACGGIGAALAAGLARLGARLLLTDRAPDPLDALRRTLPGRGHEVFAAGLGGAAQARDLVASVVATVGAVDVLVHTAAVLRRQELTEVTEADWDAQHEVNLKATFFLAREVAEHQRAAGLRGSLVLFSSQSFWTGGYGDSLVYATTKGGVTTMVRGLARTYGPAGIRVNAVAPGVVATPMVQGDRAGLDEIIARTPLRRVAEPAEMVGPVAFLAGPSSSFVTGTVLNVSGGWLTY